MIAQTQTTSNVPSQTTLTRRSVKSFTPEIIIQAAKLKIYKSKRFFLKLIGDVIEGGAWGKCRASWEKLSWMLSEELGKLLKRTAMKDLGRWLVEAGLGTKEQDNDGSVNTFTLTELGWACFYLLKKRIPIKKPTPLDEKTDPISKIFIPEKNIEDLRSYITYAEHVSICNNLETKKAKPKRKPKTHIDEAKLKAEPEAEIKRAMEAHGVDKKHEGYIVEHMKQKTGVEHSGGYLHDMFKGIKAGSWKMVLPAKPIPEYREVQKAKELEAAQPDTAEGMRNLAAIKQMLGSCFKSVN